MSTGNNCRAHAEALRTRHRANAKARRGYIAGLLASTAFVGALTIGYATTSAEQAQMVGKYAFSNVVAFFLKDVPYDPSIDITYAGRVYPSSVKELAASQILKNETIVISEQLALGSALGLAAGGLGLWLTADRRRRKQEELLADRVIAGTRIVTEAELAQKTLAQNALFPLRLGSVRLPLSLETRHIAIAGTTGAGKTTALRQLLDTIEARGQAALVYDTSGEFVANYYDPARGDVILSPFDHRGAFWSPFGEINHPADAARIAYYLVNQTGDADKDIWLEAARNLVANVIRNLWKEGRCTLQTLLDALQSMPRDELERWLANTSSARTFEKDADRATASVLFMLTKAVNMLLFLRAAPRDGETGFSLSRFFKRIDQHKGCKPWIFVPRKEDYFEAMKPLMALWLECAASAMLGLPANPSRRVWFLLDELPDLPHVANLERLLPQGRKFGACAVLSFQAIGQMRGHYGTDRGEALLSCCNTKLFLQMGDHVSREWASATIGRVEVEIPTVTETFDPKTDKPQQTLSTKREERHAVLESELRLPKYTAYLLLPDGLPVAKIRLTNDHITARGPARQPDYIAADVSETLWGGLQTVKDADDSTPSILRGPGPV